MLPRITTPRGAAMLAALWLLSAGASDVRADAHEDGGAATTVDCGLAVVERAAITDIRESFVNGPMGFAFFAEAPEVKTGVVPRAVGRDPVRRFDTDLYASNFQGPVEVRHPDLRPQWEWESDGELEVSERSYPLVWAWQCAPRAFQMERVRLHVLEHDEFPDWNDRLGSFVVDLAVCNDVLTDGRTAGWSSLQRTEGLPDRGADGDSDIAWVEYRVWCYRCSGRKDCRRDVEWPGGETGASDGAPIPD